MSAPAGYGKGGASTRPAEPKHPALRSVYWREEIIELVLWLRGEGFDERLDSDMLCRFLELDGDRSAAAAHLDRLTAHGYLQRLADGRYGLTAAGEDEGDRVIATARTVPKPARGGCGPDCWCGTSPIEASRCATQRAC